MILQVTLSFLKETFELVLEPLFMSMLCIYDAHMINGVLLKAILINL